jgi:hypothetical protein
MTIATITSMIVKPVSVRIRAVTARVSVGAVANGMDTTGAKSAIGKFLGKLEARGRLY